MPWTDKLLVYMVKPLVYFFQEVPMPIIRPHDAELFTAHGSTFASYVSQTRGARELCAWRLTVPAGQTGVAHRPSNEEVLLVLEGSLSVSLNGLVEEAGVGAVIVIPSNSEVKIDGGETDSAAWVTTTSGLQATTADGAVLSPPWAR
jgi:quercetin dioxygenase-like cupin family protein